MKLVKENLFEFGKGVDQWKKYLGDGVNNWKSFCLQIKNSGLKYRVPLEDATKHKVYRFKSEKSKIKYIIFVT